MTWTSPGSTSMPNASPDRRHPREPSLVPRRGAAAVLGTVAGVALLLSFRTPDGPTVSAADPRLALGAATPAPTQAVSGDGSTRAARTPTSTSTPAPTQTA